MAEAKTFAAFVGNRVIARAALAEVVAQSKAVFDHGADERIALFDDDTGRVVDVDLEGSEAAVMGRLAVHPMGAAAPAVKQKGPGRPKLGVVSREISLLPRHWDWLSQQPGSASVTIRRLVDAARKQNSAAEQTQRGIEAAHRFMWDMAGDLPNFEETSWALFAKDFETFADLAGDWPEGIREQLGRFIDRVAWCEG